MSIKRAEHLVIANRAHRLWEQAGQPEGRDLEFWLRAEGELRAGTPTVVQSRNSALESADISGQKQTKRAVESTDASSLARRVRARSR